ncbi:MAG: ABC transporter substrate-binding protein [Actinomycetia bacterium]|nr:ABC transporter substrate-binding protein [Actinomycetes bacterium]
MTSLALRRSGKLLAGLVAAGAVLAACSSSDSTESASPAPSASVDEALAALVPDDVKSSGKITYGTDASYAPSEFIDEDGTTIVGFDVDLGKAIAQKLGLEGEFENATFDSIIVGVDKGKYNSGMSSFTINPDRLKQANMVSYFSAGTAWAAASGNPEGVNPDDACGKTVAVQKATVQAEDIEARNKDCTDAGNSAIDIQTYTLQSDATTAVANGKADAMLADSPVISYAIQQSGKIEQIGDVYDSAPYGIVIAKDQTEFAEAIQGAVDAIIEDGTYGEILESWNVSNGAVTKAELNPAS